MKRLPPALVAAALLGSGCVAIPMGTETFTVDSPTVVSNSRPSEITSVVPVVAISQNPNDVRILSIGLVGDIATSTPREQRYERVSVEKRKYMAFGFFPGFAEVRNRRDELGALRSLSMWKCHEDGRYTIGGSTADTSGNRLSGWGSSLGFFTLTSTIYSTIFAPVFQNYECNTHHWGDAGYTKNVYYANLLSRFPASERMKIGAWIRTDEKEHPHSGFVDGFTHSALFGFHKYCAYVVKGPAAVDKTIPAAAKKENVRKSASGPFKVELSIRELDFTKTEIVGVGDGMAEFDLTDIADGRETAEGMVRFLAVNGSGGDDVTRRLLEAAGDRTFPVSVKLPPPLLSRFGRDSGSAEDGKTVKQKQKKDSGSYDSIRKRRLPDGTVEVRVSVRDPAWTLDVDHEIRPKIKRLFQEDFSEDHPDVPESAIRVVLDWWTENDGRELVYTASVMVQVEKAE